MVSVEAFIHPAHCTGKRTSQTATCENPTKGQLKSSQALHFHITFLGARTREGDTFILDAMYINAHDVATGIFICAYICRLLGDRTRRSI
jgi:hypothetical protein